MGNQFCRTELLLGTPAMEKLKNSRVAVFGIGGVGGHCAEALVRSGIGAIDIIDDDLVSESNINRQIIALRSTIGRPKVDVAEERFLDINPEVKITKHRTFFLLETADEFDFRQYDYIVDAIDTVAGKLLIAEMADALGIPVISSMGAGNKLDPTAFEVTDINKTSVCPLAKVMRQELRKRGIKKLKVVYSKEPALGVHEDTSQECISECFGDVASSGRPHRSPGSNAFVPSVAGLILAGEVIKDLTGAGR